MTPTQKIMQCDGPARPTAAALAALLHQIPSHFEIRAVSIKGQGGAVVVEVTHEGMDDVMFWMAVDHHRGTGELLWERQNAKYT